MSVAFAAFALLVSVCAAVVGRWGLRPLRIVNAAGWVGLVAGLAMLQFVGEVGAAGVLATSGLGAVAGLRVGRDPDRARRDWLLGSAPAIALCAVALFCGRDVALPFPNFAALLAAFGAAAAAALGSAFAAAKDERAVGVLTVAAAAALLAAASGRSSLPGAFYGFALSAGDAPLQFRLPPVEGLEEGVRLSVSAPVELLGYLIAAIGVGGLLSFFPLPQNARKGVGAACAALGAVGLASLQTTAANIRLPSADPYADHLRNMLLERGLSEQLTSRAAFNVDGEVSVAMADLAPEVGFLALLVVLGVATFTISATERPAASEEALFAHFRRATAYIWLAWFAVMILHVSFLGVWGTGAPGEWLLLGTCLAWTGLALLSAPGASERLRAWIPAAAAGVLLLSIGAAWRFGAILGLSVGTF